MSYNWLTVLVDELFKISRRRSQQNLFRKNQWINEQTKQAEKKKKFCRLPLDIAECESVIEIDSQCTTVPEQFRGNLRAVSEQHLR